MVTQRQVAAILILGSAIVGLGFAVYNLYVEFQNSNQTLKT
jgi:hypothetical protein